MAELRGSHTPHAVVEETRVLEVLLALMALYGHDIDDIIRVAAEKRAERGSVAQRLWLEPWLE